MIWDIDIKIRGKIVGHWYQQFHGVPYKSYCVYSAYFRNHVLTLLKSCLSASARRICTEQGSMNVSHWITWNRSTNQRRDCLSPCNFLLINVGSKNSRFADNVTLGRHQLFFAPRQVFWYEVAQVVQILEHYLGIISQGHAIKGKLSLHRTVIVRGNWR